LIGNMKTRILLALATLMVLFGAACATDDENMSERPWNAPKSWEHGIPQSMQQGR